MTTLLLALCIPFLLWVALGLLTLGLGALSAPKGGGPKFTLRNLWVIMRHLKYLLGEP